MTARAKSHKVKRSNFGGMATENVKIYAGSYPPETFENWGQENIFPFLPPEKPFEDLT